MGTYLTPEYYEKLKSKNLNIQALPYYPSWKIDTDSWRGMSINNIEVLLYLLKIIYEKWFGDEYVCSKELLFTNKQVIDKCPACFYSLNTISLYMDGEFWHQFIFQAAHELCHFMSYKDDTFQIPEEFMWFMESVCQAASLSALSQIYELCKLKLPISNCENYAVDILNYYNGLITKIENNKTLNVASLLVKKDQELRNESCNRELNAQFAYLIHKNYGRNNKFWLSIPYIGTSGLKEEMSTNQFFNKWLNNLPLDLQPTVLSLCNHLGVFTNNYIIR